MVAYLFFGLVAITIAGWLWFFIVRPILEDYKVIGPRTVNYYQSRQKPATRAYRVMSRPKSRQTAQTAQTDRVFAPDPQPTKVQLDKTRAALIELLVYNGWGTGDIRGVLKGDSGAIGSEVAAARQKLGIDPDPPRMIVVNKERRIAFRENDPELAYQSPPN